MQGRLLLDVVVGKRTAVLELLAGEDEALLVRGNAFLVLDLGLHIVCSSTVNVSSFWNSGKAVRDAMQRAAAWHKDERTDGVRGLHLKGDGLARHWKLLANPKSDRAAATRRTGLHEDLHGVGAAGSCLMFTIVATEYWCAWID
jgi:hypothetical protein